MNLYYLQPKFTILLSDPQHFLRQYYGHPIAQCVHAHLRFWRRVSCFGTYVKAGGVEEIEENMRQAIRMHLEGMLEDQEPLPVPQTTAEYLDIPIPGSAA